jgi:hypothetical protein
MVKQAEENCVDRKARASSGDEERPIRVGTVLILGFFLLDFWQLAINESVINCF